MAYKLFRIDNGKKLKTTSLGFCRVSPRLIELMDQHVEQNHIKNRSEFIRYCIRKELKPSVQDIIDMEKPFMPILKKEAQKK